MRELPVSIEFFQATVVKLKSQHGERLATPIQFEKLRDALATAEAVWQSMQPQWKEEAEERR